MTVDKNIKEKITTDWNNNFPELSLYSHNKLYKIVGALIIGIELIKLPRVEEYRPYLVIYPLWRENVKSCLDKPILLKEFYNKKGVQFDIPYLKHENYFNEVVEIIKLETFILTQNNVTIEKILYFIDDCYKKSIINTSTNSYLYGRYKESIFKINLYYSHDKAEEELNKINKINWNIDNFKHFGLDTNDWLQSLKNELNSRNNFLKQIETNKLDKKIVKLRSTELT